MSIVADCDEQALDYAARGWRCFPLHSMRDGQCTCGKPDCSDPGKHPRINNWQDIATTDTAQLRRWWQRWPDANVAIATGAASALVVLDVDPDKGGDESLRVLEARHGALPDTVESLTGGGGRHLLFQHPGALVGNRTGFEPGLDIRGDGGYIVAAPSLHESGVRYEWEVSSHPDDQAPAPMPTWLRDAINVKANGDRAEAVPETIPSGRRNATLMSLAGTLRARGLTVDEIAVALGTVNAARCQPPLEDAEVQAIAASVGRYAAGELDPPTLIIDSNGHANEAVPPADVPEPGELLTAVATFVTRYVVMSPAQRDTVALWVAHTHAFEACDATPYLSVTSAEKRSGKTRLLECLELLSARPWLTGRTTAAALARKIDKQRSTLLLDESDTAFRGEKDYAETLRGVLNSGHRRGGAVTVCVGQGANLDFRDFSTFAPKAIAGIGKLPDTVADRSIPLDMKRKKPGETVERFRHRIAAAEAKSTQAGLATWAVEAVPVLLDAEPELPDELDDRAQDGWEPLLAIADLAGADWPERARAAALVLSAGRAADDSSLGVRLLTDIRTAFDMRSMDRLPTAHLLATLNSIEAAPWGGFHDGHGMTARDLADILKRYRIEPRVIKLADEKTARGYRRVDFNDAWARYVPEKRNQRNHPHVDAENDQKTDVTEAAKLRQGKAEFPHVDAKVTQVTHKGGLHGENGLNEPTGQQFCRVCNAVLPLQHLRNLGLCWECAEAEAVPS